MLAAMGALACAHRSTRRSITCSVLCKAPAIAHRNLPSQTCRPLASAQSVWTEITTRASKLRQHPNHPLVQIRMLYSFLSYRPATDTPRRSYTDTTTSFRTLSSPRTVNLLSRARGTRPSVCGTSTPVPPPADSSDTPRTSSRSRSAQTTGRSFPVLVIAQSSYGTPSESASLTSERMVTPSGSPASGSRQTQ